MRLSNLQISCATKTRLLVSGTETKVQFQYRSWNFFSWNQNFFLLQGRMSVSKIWKLITDLQKQSKNLYDCALLWMKKYPILLVTIFFISNTVSVSLTVSAESLGQFRFQFWYWTLIKKGGFSRTLLQILRYHSTVVFWFKEVLLFPKWKVKQCFI